LFRAEKEEDLTFKGDPDLGWDKDFWV